VASATDISSVNSHQLTLAIGSSFSISDGGFDDATTSDKFPKKIKSKNILKTVNFTGIPPKIMAIIKITIPNNSGSMTKTLKAFFNPIWTYWNEGTSLY
jgi:hypothetical protein